MKRVLAVADFFYEQRLEPVDVVLDQQKQENLHKNLAQTYQYVYELTDEQARLLSSKAEGTGSVFTGNWVPGANVHINGERVIFIQFRGSFVKMVLPASI